MATTHDRYWLQSQTENQDDQLWYPKLKVMADDLREMADRLKYMADIPEDATKFPGTEEAEYEVAQLLRFIVDRAEWLSSIAPYYGQICSRCKRTLPHSRFVISD